MRSLDLPFSTKSPETLIEEQQERRPREYAWDIFKRFPASLRMAQVDKLVPPHLREHVRKLLKVAADFESGKLQTPNPEAGSARR